MDGGGRFARSLTRLWPGSDDRATQPRSRARRRNASRRHSDLPEPQLGIVARGAQAGAAGCRAMRESSPPASSCCPARATAWSWAIISARSAPRLRTRATPSPMPPASVSPSSTLPAASSSTRTKCWRSAASPGARRSCSSMRLRCATSSRPRPGSPTRRCRNIIPTVSRSTSPSARPSRCGSRAARCR